MHEPAMFPQAWRALLFASSKSIKKMALVAEHVGRKLILMLKFVS